MNLGQLSYRYFFVQVLPQNLPSLCRLQRILLISLQSTQSQQINSQICFRLRCLEIFEHYIFHSLLYFLLQQSQTRTSVVQPRSGTGRRPCEHSSQTAWPQARQWCRFRSRTGEYDFDDWCVFTGDECIPSRVPSFCEELMTDVTTGRIAAVPDISCSAVPNSFVHTEHAAAS